MIRRLVFYKIEKWAVTSMGPKFRKIGQSIFNMGEELCGKDAASDKLVPSLRNIPVSNKVFPKLLKADWVAPNATVIGDVKLGDGSSLWHATVVRGDTAKISIGKNSIIQDRSLLKSSNKEDGEISIGDNVFIGPN